MVASHNHSMNAFTFIKFFFLKTGREQNLRAHIKPITVQYSGGGVNKKGLSIKGWGET